MNISSREDLIEDEEQHLTGCFAWIERGLSPNGLEMEVLHLYLLYFY